MEKLTQKWAIVCLLEDAKPGAEFYYTDFPLHVTMAGVFATDKSGQQLIKELGELLHDQTSITIEASEKTLLGPNKDVAVMKLRETPELMSLHNRVHTWLIATGAVYNSPAYQGKGYLPHSTFQKSGSLKEGEIRKLQSISLIDLFPNSNGYQRKIYSTVQFA